MREGEEEGQGEGEEEGGGWGGDDVTTDVNAAALEPTLAQLHNCPRINNCPGL